MTEQEKREKVIKGLGSCVEYFASKVNGVMFDEWLEESRKAIALLKAQEPRVMTLEEYKAWMDIPFQERDPIFHEMKLRRGPVTGWTNTADCCVENYGKIERCWTSRPTDEQREAVKWE